MYHTLHTYDQNLSILLAIWHMNNQEVWEMKYLVRRMHVKVALNVVKAWNFYTNEDSSCWSRIDSGAFRKFSRFVRLPIWLLQTKVFH